VTKKKEKLAQKQQTKSDEPVSKRKEEFEDAPMFKLMLLQDDGADVAHGTTNGARKSVLALFGAIVCSLSSHAALYRCCSFARRSPCQSPSVITRLCSIVDDMDEDQAATVFEQAQMVCTL
jgi:hypothetical protein